MKVKYEDVIEKEFSAMIPILKTGILINKKLDDTPDAYTFFSSNGRNSGKIVAVKFYSDNQGMFKPDVGITLKTYTVGNP